jgi:DNA-binding NarL/FixJ family response regulator
MSRHRVLVIEHDRLFRECLGFVLSTEFDVILSDSLRDLSVEINEHEPDLILIGAVHLSQSGLGVVSAICRLFPRVRVAVLGCRCSPDSIAQYLVCGARRVISAESSVRDLKQALLAVLKLPALPKVSATMNPLSYQYDSALTMRETQVLRLVQEELSNKEIADRLRISVYTVKNHVHQILSKMGYKHRWEMAKCTSVATSAVISESLRVRRALTGPGLSTQS